jgi:hypothetical protein
VKRDDGIAWLALAAVFGVGALAVSLIGVANGGLAVGTPWSTSIDWQPGTAARQPWRLWTCAWVHWSVAHLLVNLLGVAVVSAVGWRARSPSPAAIAWFIAWPLTHLLLSAPDVAPLAHSIQHYGGLSGVLHAGVVVLGLTLAWPPARVPEARGRARPRTDPGFVATRASTIEPSRITEGPWAMTGLEELPSTHTVAPASSFEAAPLLAEDARALRDRWIGVAIVAGTVIKVLLESPWSTALRPNAMLGIDVAPLAHACGIVAGVIAWGSVATLLRVRDAVRA